MAEGVLCGESGSDEPPKYILGLMSPRAGHKREFEFAAKVQVELIGSLGQRRCRTKETILSPEVAAEENQSAKAESDPNPSPVPDVSTVLSEPEAKVTNAIEEVDVDNGDITEKDEKTPVSKPWVSLRRITRSEFKRLNDVQEDPELEDSERPFGRQQRASEPIRVFKRRRLIGDANALKAQQDSSEVVGKQGGSEDDAVAKKGKTDAEDDPSSVLVADVERGNSVSVEFAEGLDGKEPICPKVEEELGSKIAEGSSSAVICAKDQEESGSSTDDAGANSCSIQENSKKLELKMSKKITLTKFPKTIKELLGTGVLNGCKVHYLCRRSSGKEPLRGVIKDGMILCFCGACKGKQTVTPIVFELHAGSLNKRAIDYIYLENGRTIRDVLRSCDGTPLELFEERMQTELRLSANQAVTCQRCKSYQDQWSHPNPLVSFQGIRISDKTGNCVCRDLGLHKLVFMSKGLPDGTEVAYYARGQRLLEGYKQGAGIFCYCCNSEVSPSQFEAHAGWASRRKPYLHIYTSDGVSLHELAMSLLKGRKMSANDNDDLCTICGDGGDLLLCDGCPRAFHTECVALSCIPRGNWYCSYCGRNFEQERNAAQSQNALAAGRIPDLEALENLRNRCTRVVKKPQVEIGGCVLCRGHDFSKSGFGPRTVMLCDQCEREFHVGCLRDHGLGDLKELPKEKWFCCTDCSRINTSLQKLILRGAEKLPPSLSNIVRKKLEEKDTDANADLDISWQLLSGKNASPDSRLLLSKAVAIFQDCFDPIIDTATGRDMIPPMVYGRNIRGQEFGGVYCAVLKVNSVVVSAGILRIFGNEVAELPLVATTSGNQGKGYFQSLFTCIERFLGFLEVKNLVLPAADEAESIWTKRFGFSKMTPEQVSEYTRDVQMMTFQGTSMLQKLVPKCRLVNRPVTASAADAS
ncbi:Increased DNA methylation 1 [Nymphaea thermarum]|nr:Increased DNA methylation 1 [Nymphaea thermarum]